MRDEVHTYGKSPSQRSRAPSTLQVTPKLWTPFSLSYYCLLIFAFACLSLIGGIETIYQLSLRNHGLASSDQRYHYYWTYAPTAIFTILIIAWRRVEYRVKQITPWVNMEKSATASSSLFLDYISSNPATSIIKAIKAGHYQVVIAVMGTILIQVVIIISTGLLILRDTPDRDTKSLYVTLKNFDGTDFRTNLQANLTDALPIYTYHGIKEFNLSYPIWTTDSYNIQPFTPTTQSNISAQIASVDVFSAGITCDIPKTMNTSHTKLDGFGGGSGSPNSSIGYADLYTFQIESDDCTLYNFTLQRSGRQHGLIQTLSCQDDTDSTTQALVIAIIDITAQGAESNILICKPTYRVQKATVTIQDSMYQIQVQGSNRSILGVSPWDFNEGLQTSLSLASVTSALATLASNQGHDFDPFTSLLFVTDPTLNFSDLMNASILQKTSGELYTSLAVQFANRYLTMDSNTSFIGTSEFTRPRLIVNALSVRLIETLLAVTLILSLTLSFAASRGVVPTNPGYIATSVAILNSSELLLNTLRQKSSWNEMKAILASLSFRTVIYQDESMAECHRFKIEASPTQASPIKPLKQKFWRPLSYKLPVILTTILMPIAIIISLQVLLMRSELNGLGDVQGKDIHYLWSYLPGLVMVLTGYLTTSLYSSTNTLSVYRLLKRKTVSASALFRDAEATLPINNFFKFVWELSLLSIAALLVPFLTIVVSGLYTTVNNPNHLATSIIQTTFFNDSPISVQQASIGTFSASLIQTVNLSFPQWTYGEFTLANIRAVEVQNHNSRLYTRVPGIRANINCTQSLSPSPPSSEAAYYNYDKSEHGFFGSIYGFDDIVGVYQQFVIDFGRYQNGTFPYFVSFTCMPYLEVLDVDVSFRLPEYSIDAPPVPLEETKQFFSSNIYDLQPTYIGRASSTNKNWDAFFSVLIYGGNTVNPESFTASNETLINSVQHLYRVLMAQALNLDRRYTLNTPILLPTKGIIVTDREHLIQNSLSTHILQGLLSVITLCIILSYGFILLRRPKRDILPESPTSIAAIMLLLVHSRLVNNILPGSEWWEKKQWLENPSTQDWELSLGDWSQERNDQGEKVETWYGIELVS